MSGERDGGGENGERGLRGQGKETETDEERGGNKDEKIKRSYGENGSDNEKVLVRGKDRFTGADQGCYIVRFPG